MSRVSTKRSIAVLLSMAFLNCMIQSDSIGQESTPDQANSVKCKLPELRVELLERMEKDQIARQALINSQSLSNNKRSKNDQDGKKPSPFENITAIDKENREWLKTTIEQHGWLGKSLVGEDGAHAAWLLVQHADRDLEFQKQCLELMTNAAKGEVSGKDLAYLTDRVLNAEGKPQLYGTQIRMVNGDVAAPEVEDPENLDKRRKDLGLSSMEEYLDKIREVYKLNKPGKKSDNNQPNKQD